MRGGIDGRMSGESGEIYWQECTFTREIVWLPNTFISFHAKYLIIVLSSSWFSLTLHWHFLYIQHWTARLLSVLNCPWRLRIDHIMLLHPRYVLSTQSCAWLMFVGLNLMRPCRHLGLWTSYMATSHSVFNASPLHSRLVQTWSFNSHSPTSLLKRSMVHTHYYLWRLPISID